MHISEGVLSPGILAAGAALAAAGTTLGLHRLRDDRLMTAALLSSAFFVASLIHVPFGPGSVHLVLNGFLGLLLGWAAFPAIAVALALQALLFQFGGITVLGVNAVTMALPAVACHYVFRPFLTGAPRARFAAAFCCGAFSVAGSAVLTALALTCTDEGFLQAAELLLAAHVPVMIVEGCLTGFLLAFLSRVRPEILCLFDGGSKPCAE